MGPWSGPEGRRLAQESLLAHHFVLWSLVHAVEEGDVGAGLHLAVDRGLRVGRPPVDPRGVQVEHDQTALHREQDPETLVGVDVLLQM